MDADKILKGQDFYVPRFQITLKNRPLDRGVIFDVIQVTYKDDINEIDSFELTINNWDAENRAFKYSDQKLFDPGQQLELRMGYYNQNDWVKMITGEITSLRPTFPASGQPTLVVSGLNLLHRLRKKKRSDSYKDKTDTQIAKEIAQRLGVSVDPPTNGNEKPYDHLFQDDQYDIVFLMERARRIDYDLYVVEEKKDTIFFGPSNEQKCVTFNLEYGKSLIQFQPNLTTANQVGKVTVRGWDAVRKRKISETATREQIEVKNEGKGRGQFDIANAFGDREEIVTTPPVESSAEAKRVAKDTLRKIVKDMIKGSGSTIGLPDLRAGSILKITGLGDRFSGRYFVTATTHTINDSGYVTQFECRKEETKQD
jgi:phage protein D